MKNIRHMNESDSPNQFVSLNPDFLKPFLKYCQPLPTISEEER